MQFGLKLWSANTGAIDHANTLYDQGVFDFIELYAVPGTHEHLDKWKAFRGQFMVHCAHSTHGFNLAKAENEQVNKDIFKEAQVFADGLGAQIIVMHGGNGGPLDEAVRQLSQFDDERIHIENKPKFALDGNVCIGWSPDEIKQILDIPTVKGLVLDLGHAFYAANASNQEPIGFIKEFLQFSPKIFHVGDGDSSLTHDCHKNIGEGDFDLPQMLDVIGSDSAVTLETPGDPNVGLDYFVNDLKALKERLPLVASPKILFLTEGESNTLFDWLKEQGEDVVYWNQPINSSDVDQIMPDLIISYNYRYILKKDVIDKVNGNVINLHIAYLPYNRGAHPNVWSILDDTPKGVTIHYIDEGVDTGDIILQREVNFDEQKATLKSSYDNLHVEIQTLFKDNWDKIKNGKIQCKSQEGQGSFHTTKDAKVFESLIQEKGWDTSVAELKENYRVSA